MLYYTEKEKLHDEITNRFTQVCGEFLPLRMEHSSCPGTVDSLDTVLCGQNVL